MASWQQAPLCRPTHVPPSLVVPSLVTNIVAAALRALTPVCPDVRADGQQPACSWKPRVIGSSVVFRACLDHLVLEDPNITNSDQRCHLV